MEYIVLDLEWNQCPQGKEKEEKSLPFEIIEIGAVKLDEDCKPLDKFHTLICPVVYQDIHMHTRDVIGLSMEELKAGKPFAAAILEFLDWCGEDYFFCTWGSMDLTELQRNMKYFGVEKTLDRPLFYYDVQKLYSLCFGDGKNRLSLEHAVEELQIEKSVPFHRADTDTFYTVKIMERLDMERVKGYTSIDYYLPPKSRKEEIRIIYDTYAKYVSREFASKEEAMEDREVIATRCYLCHKNIRRKIKWFSYNNRISYSLMYCDVHGWVKGKIRMKKTDEGKVFIVKTIKITDEEGSRLIREKLNEVRFRRRMKKGTE